MDDLLEGVLFEGVMPYLGAVIIIELLSYPPVLPEYADMEECFEVPNE